jgi:hypothetical protein
MVYCQYGSGVPDGVGVGGAVVVVLGDGAGVDVALGGGEGIAATDTGVAWQGDQCKA